MADEREASVERIILFSDGVLAIAITLLILPLTEIHPTEHATLADIVAEHSAELGAFALSFAVIANYWTIHHDLFRPLQRHNGRIVLLNMFWLAAIVFLPFPTALIADGIDGGFAALYIGTLLAVSVLSLLIANYLAHHSELTDGEAAAESRRNVIASAFSVRPLPAALSPLFGRHRASKADGPSTIRIWGEAARSSAEKAPWIEVQALSGTAYIGLALCKTSRVSFSMELNGTKRALS
jgi:uncharacterized membrane protein